VAPVGGDYSRNHVVALPETPADLEPAAGILTRGEGNVVSHVQLLARALGIPNVVLAANVYEKFAAHDGRDVFFISTPGGRVVVKDVANMTADDKAVLAEYTRNEKRADEGSFDGGGAKLHIDKERLDLRDTLAIDLATMRREHSGIRCGPKAAFLGELKHLFPDKVARGVVVPFGAYHAHYKAAQVAVPGGVDAGIATAGEPLPVFVERTYAEFFGQMIPSGADEQTLATWIRPRLAVIRYSLEQKPLAEDLRASIDSELARLGLLKASDPTQTVGAFIRSDTNVEDLDNFNGAGLNLTLFNRRSLADVYAGLKEVWASPFTYRSFSWRQTLIDEPLWVLPSVIILESVATEKSGVLVTADVDGQDEMGMLIATSEGVGGAVDGTPAETIVWSKGDVELVTMFKSPYRRLLQAGGGTEVVASTGNEFVLDDADIRELTSTADTLRARLTPSRGPDGKARPWDIEFGFSKGKLWLFQVRPFVGNDLLQNVAALNAFEAPRAEAGDELNLDEAIP
jgi:phosphoenolpyruvate synthase/pyruvate phosphate dikinase